MAQIARICLTGPESTGKSALAARLAAHYGTVHVDEYARTYAEGLARELTFDDVEPIARGQLAREAEATPRARRLIVLDTDVVSSIVYATFHYGRAPDFALARAASHRADLYLLLDVDVPFVFDPLRAPEEHRAELFALFRATLERLGARYAIVSGTWAERYEKAVALIDALRLSSRA